MLYFENDYCEGAHPAILQKLTERIINLAMKSSELREFSDSG